jgi:hypothetical protein
MTAPRLDVLALLAALPDGAQLTITVSKADLVRAIERSGDAAPENLDTRQAADRFGYSAERWRRWAEAGQLAGAWQDARGGSWHLPSASCGAHIRELQRRGRAAVVRGARPESSTRSVPRGPRRPRTPRPTPDTISIETARATRPQSS